MTEIAGIDTIRGLVGIPPKIIEIGYNFVKAAERVRQAWNAKFLAFIPYCFSCKEPLVWHTNRDPSDDVLFHCPKCGRKWIKDEEWIAGEKQLGMHK